jgi:hypothetical protein
MAFTFLRTATRLQAADQQAIKRCRQISNFVRALLDRSGDAFTDQEQRQLQNSALRLELPLAGGAREIAAKQVFQLLERSSQLQRIWIGAEPQAITRQWPQGSGVVLLRVGRREAPDHGPKVLHAQYDLARVNEARLDIGNAEATYAALFFNNAPTGEKRIKIGLRTGGGEIASAQLTAITPPSGTLHVRILDATTGKPTPAAAGVFASNNKIFAPQEAIEFDQGGFYYQPGRIRANSQAHYWPGAGEQKRAFFVNGEFSVRVPQGSYRLIASKGPEYLPVSTTVAVKAGAETAQEVTLRRWINMPARGWYSGDGHVHYERIDKDANRRLMIWTQAEDIHMANVLRMGDAKETYFEQYGFGANGRYAVADYALTPGQEDPRTNVMGHTMHLNIQKPVRFPDRYYLYDLVFDEVHRQGGITGYAHMYLPWIPAAQQKSLGAFDVLRDMTLNVPSHRVDFAEICEFGDIGQDIYYDFLNMGFPLTASAGSDVPWGNTIGDSRVYAYTGDRFAPDAWFAALKAGHTFVTTGAMLEFTVNGKIAGSEIEARPGEMLHIKAAATGDTVPPRYLEVVAQGEVLRSTRSASLEFDLAVHDSTWIAARCDGAHTTPVYVKVGGRSFARRDQLPNLVARRLETLKDLDDALNQDIPVFQRGNWENPTVWRNSAAALRERIKAARDSYQQMR